jgi:hypothetical protein
MISKINRIAWNASLSNDGELRGKSSLPSVVREYFLETIGDFKLCCPISEKSIQAQSGKSQSASFCLFFITVLESLLSDTILWNEAMCHCDYTTNVFALKTLNFVSISSRPKKNCVTQRSIVKKVQRWLISISLKSSTSSLMCLWARHHASTEAPILSDSMLRLLGLTMLLVSCSFFWQVSMRYGNFQEGKMTSLESMSRVVVLWLLGMTIDCYDGLLQCGKGFKIVFHVKFTK